MYNSHESVEDGLDTNDAIYVDEINKWALVFEAMDGYINVTKTSADPSVSIEASILEALKAFSKEESTEILYNVLNMINNE